MAVPSPLLQRRHQAPYRPSVPRPPKSFQIDSVSIEPLQPRGYVPTGPDTALPSRFEAHFVLGVPDASVTVEIFVSEVGPVVVDLSMRTNAQSPITTTKLRQVLVDQLLQKAIEEATVPGSVRVDWLSSLPPAAQRVTTGGSGAAPVPALTAEERTRNQFDEDARTAARLFSEAVAAGSKSPGMAVAEGMNRSRAQAARYIRRARALRLLPSPAKPDGA